MDTFKEALRAALRNEPVDLDAFGKDDRELIAMVKAHAASLEFLAEQAVDARAQDAIIKALVEREAQRAPAVLA